jgi:hypothetical protein
VKRFPTKDPKETWPLTFDASVELDDGETLTGVTDTTVTLLRGNDDQPQNVVSGAAVNTETLTVGPYTIAAGKGVQAIASGGVDDCEYLIRITCSTSNPNKKPTLKAVLPVAIED